MLAEFEYKTGKYATKIYCGAKALVSLLKYCNNHELGYFDRFEPYVDGRIKYMGIPIEVVHNPNIGEEFIVTNESEWTPHLHSPHDLYIDDLVQRHREWFEPIYYGEWDVNKVSSLFDEEIDDIDDADLMSILGFES